MHTFPMKIEPNQFAFGTKAETLERLAPWLTRCTVPEFMYFSMAEWHSNPSDLCTRIADRFAGKAVIVRSSAGEEDGADHTMAGQFDSVPGVASAAPSEIRGAVDQVVASYGRKKDDRSNGDDHILVQIMIRDVLMAGVLFTQDLSTGAPYYVINYDDETGRTDTVTGGGEYSNRTLYVHRGSLGALRSTRFGALIDAVAELEQVIGATSLDVEFAVDTSRKVHLFQVRQVAAQPNWNRHVVQRVDDALPPIQQFVRNRFKPVPGVRGRTSVFGQMPDWNPAEMIGRAPRPLALSLYRHLITDRAWRVARAEMGYAEPRGHPLMASFGGQPFVDVRLSFHSFLPAAVPEVIGNKLVDAWLDRIIANTHLHDKVEFEVAVTALAFDFEDRVERQFPDALDSGELKIFRDCLRDITVSLVSGKIAPISGELETIKRLASNHEALLHENRNDLGFVASLLEDCIQLGTIPFSILARHAFIAQALLDSLVTRDILSANEAQTILASVKTVAREFTDDAAQLVGGKISREQFMDRYGHLRPGTYDILSPRYDQRGDDIFGQPGRSDGPKKESRSFKPTARQTKEIDAFLDKDGFGIGASQLLEYVSNAISAREHAKFIFTRNISDSLEQIADWGSEQGLSRSELSFVTIDDLLGQLVAAGPGGSERHLRNLSEAGRKGHETTVALRLPQLLFDEEGVHVVPLQLSAPNYFSNKTVRGQCIQLSAHGGLPYSIHDAIVLIESADPGFDWIFAHGIKALVTKFGGVNSHMAIRCAEFGIPAAIGCGEQIFDRIARAQSVEIDCSEGHIRPLSTDN